jgi:hypothetical protein
MHWLIEFIFPRRLHRVAFFLRVLFAASAENIFIGIGGTMNSLYLLAAFTVLIIYELLFIDLPRIRDLEMNGWWLLLFLVPGADIVLGTILLLRAPVFLHLQGEPIRAGQTPGTAVISIA